VFFASYIQCQDGKIPWRSFSKTAAKLGISKQHGRLLFNHVMTGMTELLSEQGDNGAIDSLLSYEMKMDNFPNKVFLSGNHGKVPTDKLNRDTIKVNTRNVHTSERAALRSLAKEMDISHSTVNSQNSCLFTQATLTNENKYERFQAALFQIDPLQVDN
jgi:hypothetical protein